MRTGGQEAATLDPIMSRITAWNLMDSPEPPASVPLRDAPPLAAAEVRGPEPARTRVLVVDDHPMNAELLGRNLRRIGYEVLCADSGREALRVVVEESPDIVLMDVMMPDLSGLDVLRRLRDGFDTADLPVILVSGLGETQDIVEGLKLGANDYVTKPINFPVLQARLASQSALKRARDALKHTATRLSDELTRQADELRVAGHVQRSILPQKPPNATGLATAWCYEPATEVGGDLYDVIPLAGGRTLLFLADAMGHGVQAALVAATVKATLAAHLSKTEDLVALMEDLDGAVARLFEDRFVTAAACVVDPSSRRLSYVLAGHPPILVRGRDGVQPLTRGGLPLGTCAGLGFPRGEVTLDPGSQILLYSDGLTEAAGPDGRQLGVDRLQHQFASIAGCEDDAESLVRQIRTNLDAFRNPGPLADDLTILAACLLHTP